MEPAIRSSFMGFAAYVVMALPLAPGARGETVQEFYTGKTINMIVSTGAGNIFDVTARMVAKHLTRFIPGSPNVVVRNMPGGGHIRATQFMFTQAAKDGTYIGIVNNGIPLEQIVTGPSVRFDVRNFNWIGSAGLSNLLTMTWHTSDVRTVEDARHREAIMGATGVSSNGYLYPNVMNMLLGTKFKIVSGYGTSGEADLGMERGEVNGRAGFSLSAVQLEHPDWLRDKKINVLAQAGLSREKSLPDVPLMQELARNEEQRSVLMMLSSTVALGRPFFMPPEVPAERVAAVRKAFDDMAADSEFRRESDQAGLDIRLISGEKLSQLVNSIVNTPESAANKLRAAFGREPGSMP